VAAAARVRAGPLVPDPAVTVAIAGRDQDPGAGQGAHASGAEDRGGSATARVTE